MNMPHTYDIIIIGAGPIGLACGIEAAREGLSYLIIEAGCLVNSLYHYPVNMTFFSTSERLEIGGVPFISHGYKPTRSEALEYYRRVTFSWNLSVKTYERVLDIKDLDYGYLVKSEKGIYTANNVVIATGFYGVPNLMNIPGESLKKVRHYYDEPHPYAAQELVIVGGGNSAVDAALETFRRGAHVTMVIAGGELDPGVKYWVRPDIDNRIKEGSINAYFNSTIKEIREDEVDLCTPEGEFSIKNDFVLAMTGYQPDYTLLKKAGVKISHDELREPYYDGETFQTNKEGLFLAGCVCGGMNTSRWNIESSRYHAERIIKFIKSRK
ncbi:MAG: YpdA family putative bacillithiol disulfide reductase [Ignavibacteria bacterium]|jgi:thioredoxin reductase (NADPH)|nr:YpdA family putative bacillithiol disulfide reductase [Ignavibacteria bacterium]MCU7500495.1 YpdA family putative bacillithiol disulfide reductase [Ignavibacteria bacterium]MCU7512018.1 YpdA family putative bacillithiol disulfide reductase [Ignavibacteria bacterium]MCU7521282.1 YpdA family putative bacillithiol disulfide reductase [Ignavibacteria bacterium]MCU7525725.1 YpdA family putative bacillithiol disulfide reductase [Ignavibacteria bacterium]